jgi:hypothetical protein
MLDWDVETDDVVAAVTRGETIEEYEDGSRLVLGRAGVRPLHVVLAPAEEDTATVVTVYEPSLGRWDAAFRVRREQ